MLIPPNLRRVFTVVMALAVLPSASRVALATDDVGRTPTVEAPTVRPLVNGDYDSYRKNRYISVVPGNTGIAHRLRLTLTRSDMIGVDGVSEGLTLWTSGPPNTDSFSNCMIEVTTVDPGAAGDAIFDACPVVHIKGCGIVPTTEYAIHAVSGSEVSPTALSYGTQLKPGVKWWGDCVGNFNGAEWLPPQGTANVDDAVATIKGWQYPGMSWSPHWTLVDNHPNYLGDMPQGHIGFNDVFQIIQGFKGLEYPGNDLTWCP